MDAGRRRSRRCRSTGAGPIVAGRARARSRARVPRGGPSVAAAPGTAVAGPAVRPLQVTRARLVVEGRFAGRCRADPDRGPGSSCRHRPSRSIPRTRCGRRGRRAPGQDGSGPGRHRSAPGSPRTTPGRRALSGRVRCRSPAARAAINHSESPGRTVTGPLAGTARGRRTVRRHSAGRRYRGGGRGASTLRPGGRRDGAAGRPCRGRRVSDRGRPRASLSVARPRRLRRRP